MEIKNKTLATEFILLGFSNDKCITIPLFVLFFIIYVLTCLGNILIVCMIIIHSHLHTTMYFFLCNLSFLDLCYSSNALPRLLVDIINPQRMISFHGCIAQLYSSLLLGGTECLLLVVMAYDRYVAICRPLHYSVIMSWDTCYKMSLFTWIGSFILTILPSFGRPLLLCNPNKINHFMCDVLAVSKLNCKDTELSELLIFCVSLILLLLPFTLIIISYICIFLSILKIDSVARGKAFSTCTSHLTVVSLYYGTGMIMYSGSTVKHLPNTQKYVSVMYVIITPMLNPLIYSLKNKDVKEAFRKSLQELYL